jgi:hypothetical protein
MSRLNTLAIVYVIIAVLTNFQGGLKDSMTAHDWTALAISSLLGGLIALRAFLDRTSGEQSASDKLAAAGTPSAILPPPSPAPAAEGTKVTP